MEDIFFTFFSWEKTVAGCKGDLNCIFNKFSKLQRNLPDGSSFICNLNKVLKEHTSIENKVVYIYLASLRNYFDYKYLQEARLHRAFVDIKPEKIESNKLLIVEGDFIKFKYEEMIKNGH